MTMAKRVAIYVRVSTYEQTTALQHQELTAWAERAGHRAGIIAIAKRLGLRNGTVHRIRMSMTD